MVATTFAARRPDHSDVAAGDLVLRICGSSRDGQVVRLKSAKCTIGAGSRCTLRLRARGVLPLHCLILRGREGAVARCWSADTRFNHQSFRDAALSPGDRLGVGPLELEVLSVGAMPAAVGQQPETERPVDARIELERRNLEEERRRLEGLLAGVEQREASLVTQTEQLNAQLAEVGTLRQVIDQQRQQWQADQGVTQSRLDEQRKELDILLAELKSQQDVLAEQRQRWEAERTEASSQAAAQAEQLRSRFAELETQQNALAEDRRQWDDRQTESVQQSVAPSESHDAQAAELEAQRLAIQQERQQWQTEQSETQRRLDEQRDELAARMADLEAQRKALEAERGEWEQKRAEQSRMLAEPIAETEQPQELPLQEPRFETPTEKAPVDLADVFRRVGAKVELEEEEPAARTPAGQTERPLDSVSQRPAAASAADENEESIDDYMSRLMNRIRSTTGESGAASFAPQRSESARRLREASAAALASSSPASPMPAAQQRGPVEMSPRTVAPESHIDLTALRELANLSAHSAISQHSRKVLISTMYSKLAVTLVGLAAAGGLFWMWNGLGTLQITFYSALVAVLVAIYWGVQYALLTGRLIISNSGHIDIGRNGLPLRKPETPHVEDSPAEATDAKGANPVGEMSAEPGAVASPTDDAASV